MLGNTVIEWSEHFYVHFGIVPTDDAAADALGGEATLAVMAELAAADISLDNCTLSSHGYGYGADGTAIGITLAGLSALFLSGKKIEDNLDAWRRLGSRLLGAIRRLRDRGVALSVSQPAAAAIALSVIAEDAREEPLRITSCDTSVVRNPSLSSRAAADFLEHPDRYYLFTIAVGESGLEVIVVSAHGRVVLRHSLSLDKWTYCHLG